MTSPIKNLRAKIALASIVVAGVSYIAFGGGSIFPGRAAKPLNSRDSHKPVFVDTRLLPNPNPQSIGALPETVVSVPEREIRPVVLPRSAPAIRPETAAAVPANGAADFESKQRRMNAKGSPTSSPDVARSVSPPGALDNNKTVTIAVHGSAQDDDAEAYETALKVARRKADEERRAHCASGKVGAVNIQC